MSENDYVIYVYNPSDIFLWGIYDEQLQEL